MLEMLLGQLGGGQILEQMQCDLRLAPHPKQVM